MVAVISSKSAGLAPQHREALHRETGGFGGPSTAGTSPTNPLSSAAYTPTFTPSPPSTAPTPTSTHPISHHKNTARTRIAIQPAPARKSLPDSNSSTPVNPTTLVTPAAAGPPANKMSMASVISPMPGPSAAKPPMSMTSKEWVIPPRPKPGRKPATDTPPTKRKAQNRAAQRAFRERRAARVGELEELLEAEREDHEKAERVMQDRIHRLEMDAQALESRCEVLENMLDKERAERAKEVEVLRRRLHEATSQNQPPRQQSPSSIASVPQHTYAPQPLRHHRSSASTHAHDGRHSTSSLTSTTPTTTNRPATTHSFSISQIISPPEDIEQAPTSCGNCDPQGHCACAEEALAAVGCGNCTLGSRCQCLEEVLNGSNSDAGSRTTSRTAKRTIRSISPSSIAPEEKRQRGSLHLATETDFTAIFSRQTKRVSTAMSQSQLPAAAPINIVGIPHSGAPSPYSLAPIDAHSMASPHPAEDRCGFCEDGTYCVCAEAANNAAQAEPITLPSINSSTFSVSRPGQTWTPPPSEGDANGYEILPDGAVKLPSLKGLNSRDKADMNNSTLPKPSGGCGPGGPGTCAQCLADPKSGLFCRSLAANFRKQNGESSSRGGCCGGGGPGGCCKDRNNNNQGEKQNNLGVSLSCADAYKTLSSHRNFNEAADDIGNWLPLLKAAPKPREPSLSNDGSCRTPIEVEAASIMSVLKGFDVRFGRGE